MTRIFRLSSLAGALAICLAVTSAAQAAEPLKVVASFSILADLVRIVGGERVDVSVFVGPDTDMHVFQPSPSAAKELLAADLVVLNGLGLEGWADRLVKASGYTGPVAIATRGVAARQSNGRGHHDHGHDDSGRRQAHSRGARDPHAWQDPRNVKLYVTNIRDALAAVDPLGKSQYETAATDYLAELDKLDAEIRAILAPIPEERRRVITSHDSFAYFGAAYKIRFLAAQGVAGDSEPTAKNVAALIRQIKAHQVKRVFVENIANPRLIEQIAKETGAVVGGRLYSDALSGPDGPAPSYVAMMRHNTRLLAEGMLGKGD